MLSLHTCFIIIFKKIGNFVEFTARLQIDVKYNIQLAEKATYKFVLKRLFMKNCTDLNNNL